VPPTPVTGRHSFDVRATLRPDPAKTPGQPLASLPPTDTFTLTLDADVPRFIVGGGGLSQAVPATTSDGVTFRAAMPVATSPQHGSTCSQGILNLQYESLEVTVTGTSLRGTGAGMSTFVSGDEGFLLSFVADLSGSPDVTPPFWIALTAIATTPFGSVLIAPSEPLPATTTARLVSSDGSHVDLVPHLTTGDFPIISSFNSPQVVLHTGVGYTVSVDGLVDFAGNSGEGGALLRIGSIATPPLVAQDGFESVTDASLGGAFVIRTGASLPPIAGTASLYIASMGAPAPAGVGVSSSLFVRLARRPSDTKLRFSYREVGRMMPLSFAGSIIIGSVDGPMMGKSDFAQPTTGSQVEVVPGTVSSVSDTQIMEVALPDSSAEDLVVSIVGTNFTCGFGPPGTGLIIDDLRVE
jgi:hypothetical protein